MNLAEKNLQTIRSRISTIMDQLKQHQNSIESNTTATTVVESAQNLSNELSDLFQALKHQEKVLTDTFKSEIKSYLDSYGKKTTFKDYRATNVMYRNGTRIDVYTPYYLIKGSGAVESSIRRVVNLRMKGNSIFWKEDSANNMLFLRSYYKAGRWL